MQVILDSSFRPPGFSPLGSPLCGAGRKESSGTGLNRPGDESEPTLVNIDLRFSFYKVVSCRKILFKRFLDCSLHYGDSKCALKKIGHQDRLGAVSYTHLTLPTNREVEI